MVSGFIWAFIQIILLFDIHPDRQCEKCLIHSAADGDSLMLSDISICSDLTSLIDLMSRHVCGVSCCCDWVRPMKRRWLQSSRNRSRSPRRPSDLQHEIALAHQGGPGCAEKTLISHAPTPAHAPDMVLDGYSDHLFTKCGRTKLFNSDLLRTQRFSEHDFKAFNDVTQLVEKFNQVCSQFLFLFAILICSVDSCHVKKFR